MGRKKQPVSLRVLSYNLNYEIPFAKKRSALLMLLRRMDADVLCLQEVHRKAEVRWLAQHLKLRVGAWFPKGGMLVLSRFPIEKRIVRRWVDAYWNGLVGVRVLGVWIFSVHLNSGRYRKCEDDRVREIALLLKHVNRKRRCVLAGDWNSSSHLDIKAVNTKVVRRCRASTITKKSTCRHPSLCSVHLPSVPLERHGFLDVHQVMNTNREATWIPSKCSTRKTLERIDRIYAKGHGLAIHDAGTIGPKQFFPWAWPTGNDHKLIFATVSYA